MRGMAILSFREKHLSHECAGDLPGGREIGEVEVPVTTELHDDGPAAEAAPDQLRGARCGY